MTPAPGIPVGEGVVEGFPVLQRDDAEPSPEDRNIGPEANPAVRLDLAVGWSPQDGMRPRLAAAIGHALRFDIWRSLARAAAS